MEHQGSRYNMLSMYNKEQITNEISSTVCIAFSAWALKHRGDTLKLSTSTKPQNTSNKATVGFRADPRSILWSRTRY